ncbi:MAG: methyltransferase [Candidatus Woesearchaeota archaeon]
MKRKKADFFIKRYQLEHLVPLALTTLSIYFWFVYFEQILIKFIGLIVNITGLIVWWSAKITIGENWNAGYGQPKLKKLVTYGIYSKICHPMYWGINLTLIGLSLIHQKIWLILITLIIIVYFFRRMYVEDIYLNKILGNKYQEYKRKTWF